MDAAVVPLVRRQRRPTPASCARLQSRQFSAHAGDAGADQRLVADEPEGKADQDRREAREPRPLCRLPNGRGRNSAKCVRRYPQADRGTAAAASELDCLKVFVCHALEPNLREGCVLIIEIPGLFRAGWAPSQARGPPFTLEKSIGLAQGDRWRQDRPQIDAHPGNVGEFDEAALAPIWGMSIKLCSSLESGARGQ